MEMYADEDSRGGILEPEGIVNIKFRREKQLETMARLDPTYGALKAKLADPSLNPEELAEVAEQMQARERLLLPVYAQVSLQFADLHDRAGRMKAKGVIRDSLKWRNARRFFYWRVRRRLNEEYIVKRMAIAAPAQPGVTGVRARSLQLLEAWSGIVNFGTADREVALWYEENRKQVHDKVEAMKGESTAGEIARLLREGGKGGLRGVKLVLGMLPASEREEALKFLSQA